MSIIKIVHKWFGGTFVYTCFTCKTCGYQWFADNASTKSEKKLLKNGAVLAYRGKCHNCKHSRLEGTYARF